MIVPDINLLVYAYNPAMPEHAAARRWWQGLLDGSESIGMPWLVITGFIRVISNPRTMALPLSPVDALDRVQVWLMHNHVMIITPGDRHLDYLRQNLAVAYSGPDMIADAHIAALAMEYDAEVHTRDMGFDKFPNVHWRNPLREP